MYPRGHAGSALLLFSPIVFVFGVGAEILLLAIIFMWCSALPDSDFYAPVIEHRGYTHTIWFALLAGFLAATVATQIPFLSAYLAFSAAFVGVINHMSLDLLNTGAAYNPTKPIGQEIVVPVVSGGDRTTNNALALSGVLVFGTVVLFHTI